AICDFYGFVSTNQAAFARYGGGLTKVRFTASNVVVQPPFDKIVIELIHDQLFADGEAAGPATFDLAGTEAPGGPLFMRGYAWCNDYDCASTYVVQHGALELERVGAPGEPLAGYLRDVRLRQVRIDGDTGAVISFDKGKVWCVGDYRVETEVPPLSSAQGSCVEDGTGDKIGDNIRNFTLQNCHGDYVDLHERCGKHEAVWIVASAGWCGACESFVPLAVARHDELADQGLELMVVIGENAASGQPSLEYCKDYALAKGLDPATTYVDHDGTRSWPAVFGAIDTYSGGSIGLPWNAVLDGRSMEYVWSSNAGSGDLYGAQDALLARSGDGDPAAAGQ
ncbi:MAG: hypothetical protein CSA66_08140, partial [Proteobacteria bacterium]